MADRDQTEVPHQQSLLYAILQVLRYNAPPFGSGCYIILLAIIPWFRNLPFGGRATRGSRVHLPREEGARSRHQRLFEENVGKTKTCGLRTLSVKGSGFVFTHGEGISTPRVRHKGRQPSIKCANMTSKLHIFPFFCFYVFFPFILFLCIFFYLFVVDKGVSLASTYSSIAIRKSYLRSSFRTKCWLSCFHLFSQYIF